MKAVSFQVPTASNQEILEAASKALRPSLSLIKEILLLSFVTYLGNRQTL